MKEKEHRLSAVVFTDIAGFSKMMEQDEKGTLDLVKAHNDLIYSLVDKHGGEVIKTIGDAFLVAFNNTNEAVLCCVEIQNGLQIVNRDVKNHPLLLRIGIYLGDVYFYENDAMGEAINIASRLQGLAYPGKIIISREVYSLVENKLGLTVRNLGKVDLKNISKDVHVFEIDPSVKSLEAPGDHLLNKKDSTPGTQESLYADEYTPDGFAEMAGKERAEKIQERLVQVQDRIREKARNMVEGAFEKAGRFYPPVPGSIKNEIKQRAQRLEHAKVETSEDNAGRKKYFARIKDVLQRKLERLKSGFRIHASVFGAVNGFLFAINMLTSISFAWFPIPLGAWGIGLFMHWAAYKVFKNKKTEIDRFDYLSPEQLQTLEKYMNSKRGIGMHAAASAAVSAFCLLMNFYSGFGTPWFLIVAASLGVPLAIHAAVQGAIQASIRDKLKRIMRGVPRKALIKDEASGPKEYIQALKLKSEIINALGKASPDQKAMVPEMTRILDQYSEAIRVLGTQAEKYSVLLKTYDVDSFYREKDKIRKRLETVTTESLKQEYLNAEGHLDKQIKSFNILSEKEELIQMRIKSTLSALEKMKMDILMLEDLSTHMSVLNTARKKAEELEEYSRDLEEGYRILEDEL